MGWLSCEVGKKRKQREMERKIGAGKKRL